LLVATLSVAFLYKRSRPSVTLTERDTIVLADFSNSTEDPIFEDTLREALATQLQKSPFLSLVSDKTLRETLALMVRRTCGLAPMLPMIYATGWVAGLLSPVQSLASGVITFSL